ncbi:MAG: hypothetical protein E6J32_02315 [Chloroflexi bacterium]|nr:MAG: hypothetical protein E6J32_02315 [Chloroflexota bacterium]
MPPSAKHPATPVYIESGAKRVFACAAGWPGWCRSGKDEASALAALIAYAPRYAPVAKRARIPFPTGSVELRVAERVRGGPTTDFGAPEKATKGDVKPVPKAEAERLAALVSAAWAAFDGVVAGAPEALRKGPRGGGRDRDKIVDHVLGAEAAYVRKLGLRLPQPGPNDRAAVTAFRRAIIETLRKPSSGAPLTEKGWPQRYAARRIAWHVLDHAWEIEDRSEPSG